MTIDRADVIVTSPDRNFVTLKITTADGVTGLGDATLNGRELAVVAYLTEHVVPLLIGADESRIEDTWQFLYRSAYWRRGPVTMAAIAAVDMALWDIKGKMAGMPLYQLFGGRCRAGVPIYRHADGRDLEELCDNILKYQAQGITHIRCQSGGYGGGGFGPAPLSAPSGSPDGIYLDGKRYMRETLKMFDGLRSRLGFDVSLCHDVHERLKPIDAIRLAVELDPYDLFFLEDAIPLEEGEWLRQLRAKTNTPLAQGELFNNPYEWRFMITERLIDFVRVHLSQIGGITPGRKLQIFAEQFGVRTAWHGPGDMSPLAHAANIHIDLASRNFGVQEWSGTEPPNFVIQALKGPRAALLDVFPGLPEFRQGHVYANDQPGLGVEVDEAEAAKYPCENLVTHWTQTRLADGTLQTP